MILCMVQYFYCQIGLSGVLKPEAEAYTYLLPTAHLASHDSLSSLPQYSCFVRSPKYEEVRRNRWPFGMLVSCFVLGHFDFL